MDSGVRPVSVGRAVAAFLLAALVVVALTAGLLAFAQQRLGVTEAVRDARVLAGVEARDVVGPVLTDAVGRPGPAREALDRQVRRHVLSSQIVRVKIWDAGGRVIYSDDSTLIDRRFTLDVEEQRALRTGSTGSAGVSELDDEENVGERSFGRLVQVYLGVRTTSGTPLLFETYQRYDAVTGNSHRMWVSSLRVLLAGLALLYVVQAPLAYVLARRLRDSQEQREQLLMATLAASETERRRIAADLHDGVVQGLSGASYSMAATAAAVRAGGQKEAAADLDRTSRDLRRWVRELRSLVVTITPPALHAQGLGPSLLDLAASLEVRGLQVVVDIDQQAGAGLDAALESLVYRVAQEAVRNTSRHARASSVTLRLAVRPGPHRQLVLQVVDDGVGFDAGRETPRRRGSVGLELLTALAAEHGARLGVASAPGAGTTLTLTAPLPPAPPPPLREPLGSAVPATHP